MAPRRGCWAACSQNPGPSGLERVDPTGRLPGGLLHRWSQAMPGPRGPGTHPVPVPLPRGSTAEPLAAAHPGTDRQTAPTASALARPRASASHSALPTGLGGSGARGVERKPRWHPVSLGAEAQGAEGVADTQAQLPAAVPLATGRWRCRASKGPVLGPVSLHSAQVPPPGTQGDWGRRWLWPRLLVPPRVPRPPRLRPDQSDM